MRVPHIFLCVFISVLCVCMCMYVCECMHMCICNMCVSACVYVCVWAGMGYGGEKGERVKKLKVEDGRWRRKDTVALKVCLA